MRYFILTSLILTLVSGDITVIPSDAAEPRDFKGQEPAISNKDLLLGSAPRVVGNKEFSISMSSLPRLTSSDGIRSSSDSFVRGAIEAWAGHQHLVIRPEHVWYSILVQMNFYMTKHADDEAVRKTFVSFNGKQDIRIKGHSLEDIVPQFQYEIQKRVKTDWLLDWIQPNFTTSTRDDNMTANILMMGLMKSYFNFIANIICGIPSVTLVGEKDDWIRLYHKLDRIPEFGNEPTEYTKKLRPVLARFIRTFEKPAEPQIREFWQNIVKATAMPHICGESPYHVNGWINAFHHWDERGQLVGTAGNYSPAVVLDGVTYPWRDIKEFPAAFATVPIKVEDNGFEYNVTALAGMLGKKIKKEMPKGYANALRRAQLESKLATHVQRNDHWTLEPVSGWVVFRRTEQPLAVDLSRPGSRESWPQMTCLSSPLGKPDFQSFSPVGGK
jgi:hypothetical protein